MVISVSPASADYVRISWTAPTFGGEITGYIVNVLNTETDQSRNTQVTGSTYIPLEALSLEPGVSYVIRIVAYGPSGEGGMSDIVRYNSNMPGIPGDARVEAE